MRRAKKNRFEDKLFMWLCTLSFSGGSLDVLGAAQLRHLRSVLSINYCVDLFDAYLVPV